MADLPKLETSGFTAKENNNTRAWSQAPARPEKRKIIRGQAAEEGQGSGAFQPGPGPDGLRSGLFHSARAGALCGDHGGQCGVGHEL